MRIRFLLVVTLFGGMIGLSNCKRNPCEDGTRPKDVRHKTIGDSIRSKVPHTGYDTMVFVNQYGDTVFMKGVGISKYTTEVYYQGGECGGGESNLCDHEMINYVQDPELSNTIISFPFSGILISADSMSSGGGYDTPGGYSIYFIDGSGERLFYQYLNDKVYNTTVKIGNEDIICSKFGKIYYNHHLGVLQCNFDTLSWKRILL